MNHVATLKPSMPQASSVLREKAPAPADNPHAGGRRVYLAALTWAFTLFNTLRTLAYLPTIWVIHTSGDSSQHSLWTWCTWLGANATMAAWLYEQNGQRIARAVVVNTGNAVMCAVTVALIVVHGSGPG